MVMGRILYRLQIQIGRCFFTYGISGGVNYSLNPESDITAKITYLGFEDIEITNQGVPVTISGGETLSAYVGMKFKF